MGLREIARTGQIGICGDEDVLSDGQDEFRRGPAPRIPNPRPPKHAPTKSNFLSIIGFGLPAGSGLEFADELTLNRAIEGKREMI